MSLAYAFMAGALAMLLVVALVVEFDRRRVTRRRRSLEREFLERTAVIYNVRPLADETNDELRARIRKLITWRRIGL